MKLHIQMVVGVFFGVALTAWGVPPTLPQNALLRAEVERLFAEPRRISACLSDPGCPSPVREYFWALYADPDRIKEKIILSPDYPLAFRKHLISRLGYWAQASNYPLKSNIRRETEEEIPTRYALALLRAFRAKDDLFRRFAYRIYGKEVRPHLSTAALNRVVTALRSWQSDPDACTVAIPALFLTESEEQLTDPQRFVRYGKPSRFEQLRVHPNAEVRRLALEALQQDRPDKKRHPRVQLALVDFLADPEEAVVRAAVDVLTDARDSVLRDVNRLRHETLLKLGNLLADREGEASAGAKVAACRVLGGDRATTFFTSRTMTADRVFLDGLIRSLRPDQPAVLRREAAVAFEKIKPSDEASQSALIVALRDEDPSTAVAAYRALGGEHQHRGDHRIGTEEPKRALVGGLQRSLARTDRGDFERLYQERNLNLLHRNPPRDRRTYLALLQLWKVAPGYAHAAIDDILQMVSTFSELEEGPPDSFVSEALRELEGSQGAELEALILRGLRMARPSTLELARELRGGGFRERRAILIYLRDSASQDRVRALFLNAGSLFEEMAPDRELAPLVLSLMARKKIPLSPHPALILAAARELAEDENAARLLEGILERPRQLGSLPLRNVDFMRAIVRVAELGQGTRQITAREILELERRAVNPADSCVEELKKALLQAEGVEAP